MNYVDTDTTFTDWSEFGMRDETGRGPITGVSRAPGHVREGLSIDSQVDNPADRRGRSKSNLKKMFDKFLYQN